MKARVYPPGHRFDLAALPTRARADDEPAARRRVAALAPELVRYQTYLMAHEKRGLLVVLQGMDASGKDEAIRDALVALDPRGVEFKQFKPLTAKEVRHDYLWRAAAAVPARGQIGIFNRSYYEHVVVERIHPDALEAQGLPDDALEGVFEKRYRHINDFERYLVENGIAILKLFLHVSRAVQRERLQARLDEPEEQWQFSLADVRERRHWGEYMRAYSDALTETNTERAPWRLVPADRPWAARAAVGEAVLAALRGFHRGYPPVRGEKAEELAEARRALEGEDEE